MGTRPERMICVVGGSCSGKTTLEKNLQAMFGDELALFPFDDMFVGTAALEGQIVEDWESPDLYRWDDYRRHLQELRGGEATTLIANSRESVEAGIATRTIEPRRFVMAAGFLALHDEQARQLFDATVFVDLPEDEIIKRRKGRAKPDSPWDTDDYIMNGLIPGHRRFVLPQRNYVDYVFDGTESRKALAEKVAQVIRSAETEAS